MTSLLSTYPAATYRYHLASSGDQNLCRTEESKTSGKKRLSQELSSATSTSPSRRSARAIQRKRLQERSRRATLGQRFADLAELLQEIDQDFRHPTSQQDDGTAGASRNSSAFNRIDVITHAVITLRRLHKENQLKRRIIAQTVSANTGSQPVVSQLFSVDRSGLQGISAPPYVVPPGLLLPGHTSASQLFPNNPMNFGTGVRQSRGDTPVAQALLIEAQRANIAGRLASTQQMFDSSVLPQTSQQRSRSSLLVGPEDERSVFFGVNNPFLFNPAWRFS